MKEYDSSVSGRLRRFDTAFKVPIEQQNCCVSDTMNNNSEPYWNVTTCNDVCNTNHKYCVFQLYASKFTVR